MATIVHTAPPSARENLAQLPQVKIGSTVAIPYGATPAYVNWDDDGNVISVGYRLTRGHLVVSLRNYDTSPHPCTMYNVVLVYGQFTQDEVTLEINHLVFIGKDGTGSTMLSPDAKLKVAFPKRRFPTYRMSVIVHEPFRGLADVDRPSERAVWVKLMGSASWGR